MQSTIDTSATKQTGKPSKVSPEAIQAVANSTGQDIQATVRKELRDYSEAFNAFVKASRSIGPLGIEALAVACGESVGKVGRPTQVAFSMFATVLINWRDKEGNRMGFKQRNRLYEIAQRAVGSRKGDEGYYSPANEEELKKAKAAFVKSAGKGSDDTASIRLRMARPASEEIALGE